MSVKIATSDFRPHFYGIASCLGLVHPPHHSSLRNDGVSGGAQAILTSDFMKQFGAAERTWLEAPLSDESRYAEQLAAALPQLAAEISQTLHKGEVQVAVGGDHSITFASVLALSRRLPLKRVGYLQLDSHADCNTFSSSPTGNFHGIYLRSILDMSGEAALDSLFLEKLPTQNVWFMGNLDLDSEEVAFFTQHHIRQTTAQHVKTQSLELQEELASWCQQFEHIHLSCDVDGFDQAYAPATGIPCPNGLLVPTVEPLLKVIARQVKESGLGLSIDLVEVNPELLGAELTIRTAQQILLTLLRE